MLSIGILPLFQNTSFWSIANPPSPPFQCCNTFHGHFHPVTALKRREGVKMSKLDIEKLARLMKQVFFGECLNCKNYANLQAVVKICQLFISELSPVIDSTTKSWYHGTAASMECPLRTTSSPDRSWLVLLALDYTRLSHPKSNQEPVRRLWKITR